MAKLDTAAVSTILRELAQRKELEGGNPYRARAYGRAAESLALSPCRSTSWWRRVASRRYRASAMLSPR
jgi:hypothetical protein